MEYTGRASKLLSSAGAAIGDVVEVRKGLETYQGTLMPHHEFSDDSIVTLKLSNGYNVGISVLGDAQVKMVSKKAERKVVDRKMPASPSKKDVAFLGTGGTIASYVDYRTGAVHPAKSAEELAFSVPELMDLCNLRAKVLCSIYSENMEVSHWQELARAAAEEFRSGAVGVIIPHGTDTMGFSSAALSFMLRNIPGPVAFVGSQRSSDRPSSDATMNLLAATRLCVESDLGEVVVVMHGESGDSYCSVHRGTKVRKMHASRRDAFRSINAEPIARIEGPEISFNTEYTRRSPAEMAVQDKMDMKVGMVYFYPGFDTEHFDIIAKHVHGVVIAGTGLGHVSERLIGSIRKAVKDGVHVMVTTQCINGAVNLNVYSTGRDMIAAGAVPLGDMLPETAYVKLMWALGQADRPEEVSGIMLEDVAGEMSQRRRI